MLDVMYEVPSREDIARVVVTEAVVVERTTPQMLPRERPKRTRSDKDDEAERTA